VTQGAGGTITADTLGVNAGVGIDLGQAANAVSTTVAMNAAGGALSFQNANGYDIGSVAADSPVFSTTVNGLSATTDITLNTASGLVTQTQPITAAGLELQGAGSYTLTDLTNSVTTISGNTSGTVKYINAGTLDVGTVSTAGFTSVADITLNTQNSDLTVSDPITATGTVRLQAEAGNVTQGAGGTITADTLGVNALGGTGTIDLSAASNQVATAVGMSTGGGSVKFLNANGYDVNAVTADAPGFTAVTGISTSGGDVTLSAVTGNLTLSEAVNAVAGTVRLEASGGDVTQLAAGVITASVRGVNAGAAVDLGEEPNAV